jgi:hypothetical protein
VATEEATRARETVVTRRSRGWLEPPLLMTRAPAAAIAFWIRRRGAAYSGEILDKFGISESTLRRRRSELPALGIEFAENGEARSISPPSLPANCQPQASHNAAFTATARGPDKPP